VYESFFLYAKLMVVQSSFEWLVAALGDFLFQVYSKLMTVILPIFKILDLFSCREIKNGVFVII